MIDEPNSQAGHWLAEQHRAMVADLARILDLNLGLQEAMIPARQGDLVAGLVDILDLNAGVAQIVPQSSAAPQGVARRKSQPLIVGELIDIIASAAPFVRLTKRSEVESFAEVVSIVAQLNMASSLVRELARARASNLARDLDLTRNLTRNLIHASNLARACHSDLSRDRDHLSDLASALSMDLDRASYLARDRASSSASDLADAIGRARTHAKGLTDYLATTLGMGDLGVDIDDVDEAAVGRLRRVANDFTHADLRGADLSKVQLDGVRWSDATLWPPEWVDQIRRDSVDIGGGVYEIRRGAASADDDLVLAAL